MPIVLEALNKEDCDCRVEDLQKAITRYYFIIPKNILKIRCKSGHTLFWERVFFACLYLYKAHFISRPYSATYRLISNGHSFLSKYSNYPSRYKECKNIAKKIRKSENYKKVAKKQQKSNQASKDTKKITNNPLNFPQLIDRKVNSYNEGLKSRLLEMLFKKDDPYFFEQVVVDLLDNMGYKGPHGKAIRTQSSNDGGIDGIINQDPLGTRRVYLQAKMYNPKHKVGYPDMTQFIGSLPKGISKGVFITTSKYTKGALDKAKDKSIVTINGDELAKLMLEYHVGVQVQSTYRILGIDNDYFN